MNVWNKAGPLSRAAMVYFPAVNVGSAGLFYYDKQQAQRRQWRVPEKTLCMSALVGGWLGGMWAMQTFRHKTVKQSFRQQYFGSVAINVLGLAAATRSPQVRRELQKFATNRKHY